MGNRMCIPKEDVVPTGQDSTTTTIVNVTESEAQHHLQRALYGIYGIPFPKHQEQDTSYGTSPSTTAVHTGDMFYGIPFPKRKPQDTSYKGYLKKAWNILGIYVFMFDQGTDIYASHQHIIDGNIKWGCLTILFFLLPLILNGIKDTYKDIQRDHEFSVGHKLFLVMTGICLSPIRPFNQIVDNVLNILKGNIDETVICGIWFLKLLEALLESLPQASLQLFVILDKNIAENDITNVIMDKNIAENNITNVILDTNNSSNVNLDKDFIVHDILDSFHKVEDWQWVTVATSIISLSFMVSANTYLFNARNRSRFVYFFLGIITVLARLAVFSVYISIGRNLGMRYLWLVPVSTMFFGSINVWLFKRFCLEHIQGSELFNKYCHVLLLKKEVHHDWSFWGTVVMSWVLTAAYNSFTLSGLLISTSNFLLAMIAVHLDTNLIERAPFESAIILIPATFSFITNLILVIVPDFRFIREEWLNIEKKNGEERTSLY